MPESFNQEYVVSRIEEDPQVLRDRFHDYGYLFIKAYVPADRCEALMADFLEVLEPHLDYDPAGKLPVARGEPFFETDPIWDAVYPRMQSLEQFHSFFHDEHLLTLMRLVANDEVFVYPIKMARISTPGKIGHETPPHQDAYSHHAGPTMAGIWVALHEVRADTGRVKILPHSHKRGVRKVHEARGVGGVQCEIYPDETTWHVSDYEQGDVLIFHSCCVHRAEPNISGESARLSVDTRFCDYGAPVFSTNIEPHHGWRIEGLNWESIYRDWQSSEHQYYWDNYPGLF